MREILKLTKQRIVLVASVVTFLVTILGALATYLSLLSPKVTGSVTSIDSCERPCLLARLREKKQGDFSSLEVEAIFVYYRSTVLLANEQSVPFVIGRVYVFYGEPVRYEHSVAWLIADHVGVAKDVREHFNLKLGIDRVTELAPALSLKSGDSMLLEFGGLFPASRNFVDTIEECILSSIADNETQPIQFAASSSSDYVRRYIVPPDNCVMSLSMVPSGITRNKKNDTEIFDYGDTYTPVANFVKIEFVGGGEQYFPVKRRFLSSAFTDYGKPKFEDLVVR